ncbi:hypothetical protein IFU39_16340 [Paenibacillus sp. CFBP 13594]|uniref:hypothetical protein n=1 Tax=Paenibacillus sp. CFBP 13594 TaxID=2774037 RepID=UPI00177E6D29|nr:hypothetical protein [Paenibacillus sp. CFBP 13594]MBD8839382.1 hypothetical protein [Paenibacillus sp. CFBP 13594]
MNHPELYVLGHRENDGKTSVITGYVHIGRNNKVAGYTSLFSAKKAKSLHSCGNKYDIAILRVNDMKTVG